MVAPRIRPLSLRERKGPIGAKRRWEGEGLLLVRDGGDAENRKKALILPPLRVGPLLLPQAGEGNSRDG